MEHEDAGWQFWVDRGGTFTDVIAVDPEGRLFTHKLLSENPEHYQNSILQGIRHMMGLPPSTPIPTHKIRDIKMGTTVATNALLERKGEPTLLVTTKGFKDALRIGYQNRPDIFARHIQLPEMLYACVLEVEERIDASGKILVEIDLEGLKPELQKTLDGGVTSVAIVLMHGYKYNTHERQISALCREMGFQQISTSHQTVPLVKFVSRGDTTVVDAYLSPVLHRYIDQLSDELHGVKLMFMQSHGGLTQAESFLGKDAILSGPAGGVIGAVQTSRALGFEEIIGFDMGGTSTDVTHFQGQLERTLETEVAGVRMRAPMLDIHTVAAGGGSICRFSEGRFRVGPQSAGANPGPASYRRGGPLTVTDCNLILGRLSPDFFPCLFGAKCDQPLDLQAAKQKALEISEQVFCETGSKRSIEDIAQGFLDIAVHNMANAIKKISTQRGYDVSRYMLCCFGGAGGQHACAVADNLGIKTIMIHPHAGVLSALGMGLADIRMIVEHSIEKELSSSLLDQMAVHLEELGTESTEKVKEQGVPKARISCENTCRMRYSGTDTALSVALSSCEKMKADFEAGYLERFGFIMKEKSVIVESLSVEAIGQAACSLSTTSNDDNFPGPRGEAISRELLFFNNETVQVEIYERSQLKENQTLQGPVIILDHTGTNIVAPGWQVRLEKGGALLLHRIEELDAKPIVSSISADPVMLEIFNHLFMSIAEHMGIMLGHTAYSVNIKERRDYSCALFDAQGGLVANAPHMPVHLGSMSETVRQVLEDYHGEMRSGDVFLLNSPFKGGTHLPDLTVVTPVFQEDAGEGPPRLLFILASRAHHADVGGISPGSIPSNSTTIFQEGVFIEKFKLVEKGRFLEEEVRELFLSGPYPARNVDQNVSDLKAQVAANRAGLHELQKMMRRYGPETIQAFMGHIQGNAEASVRVKISQLKSGQFRYEMDQGAVVQVRVEIDPETRTATLDFKGTTPQQNNNFNAPVAVCKAAVIYVFRSLLDVDIPLNEGCMIPLTIRVEAGSILNPTFPAAVVAGNVETSQCIVDTIFGALGTMAASQGTMNNFVFGNDQFQYYETICGGSGAGPGFHGTDAVHSHMTNSRLTDPEILEMRFPVLLESFQIRDHSGGNGQWRGGNGVVRRIRFLQKMVASILSGHRRIPPYGMAGGEPGKTGENRVIRSNGHVQVLNSSDSTDVFPGDVFEIRTPGGGGYGPA